MIGEPYGLLLAVAGMAALVSLVVSSLLFMSFTRRAPPPPQPLPVLQAQRFQVVDPHGQIRASFGVGGNGAVVLVLYDQDGKVIWSAPER